MKAQYFSRRPRKVVVGVILTLTLVGLEAIGRVFQAQQTSSSAGLLTNGIYLYGEAPQPDQIGKGYVIFSHQNGNVVGAFYYPRSEFDCFVGSLRDKTLDVKSAGPDGPEIVAVKVNLSNLHPIQTISPNDQQILSVCKQEVGLLGRQLAQLFSSLRWLEAPKPGLGVVSVWL